MSVRRSSTHRAAIESLPRGDDVGELAKLTFVAAGGIGFDDSKLRDLLRIVVHALRESSERMDQLSENSNALEETVDAMQRQSMDMGERLMEVESGAPRRGSARNDDLVSPRPRSSSGLSPEPRARDPASPEARAKSPSFLELVNQRSSDIQARQSVAEAAGGGGGMDYAALQALEDRLVSTEDGLEQRMAGLGAELEQAELRAKLRADELGANFRKELRETAKELEVHMVGSRKESLSTGGAVARLQEQVGDLELQFQQLDKLKVDRSEVEELPKQLELTKDRVGKVENAVEKLGLRTKQLSETFAGVDQIKEGAKALSDSLRQETASLREWVAAALDDQRRETRTKADAEDTRDATFLLQADVEALAARLSTVGTGLEALKTKADRGELLLLKEALAAMSSDIRSSKEGVHFSARCLSCNRVFDNFETHANQVDLHHEKQRSLVMNQLQRALNNPADLEKSLNIVTVKVGKAGSQLGTDGREYGARDSRYGFALQETALLAQKGSKRGGGLVMVSPPRHKDKARDPVGDQDYRHPLRKLLGRDSASSLGQDSAARALAATSVDSLTGVLPGPGKRALASTTPT